MLPTPLWPPATTRFLAEVPRLPWPGRCCDFTRPLPLREESCPPAWQNLGSEPRGPMGLGWWGSRWTKNRLWEFSVPQCQLWGAPVLLLGLGVCPLVAHEGHPFPLLWAFTSLRTPLSRSGSPLHTGSICPEASGPGERIETIKKSWPNSQTRPCTWLFLPQLSPLCSVLRARLDLSQCCRKGLIPGKLVGCKSQLHPG